MSWRHRGGGERVSDGGRLQPKKSEYNRGALEQCNILLRQILLAFSTMGIHQVRHSSAIDQHGKCVACFKHIQDLEERVDSKIEH